mmetsp:Transcript_45397/g.107892  ORF Transcript_45397/g.107892 Transcript_45397/m.107892 type:complete len:203 (-) Transcript_45397:1089-1697(-)
MSLGRCCSRRHAVPKPKQSEAPSDSGDAAPTRPPSDGSGPVLSAACGARASARLLRVGHYLPNYSCWTTWTTARSHRCALQCVLTGQMPLQKCLAPSVCPARLSLAAAAPRKSVFCPRPSVGSQWRLSSAASPRREDQSTDALLADQNRPKHPRAPTLPRPVVPQRTGTNHGCHSLLAEIYLAKAPRRAWNPPGHRVPTPPP